MKKIALFSCLTALFVSGCASAISGSMDEVTIRHGTAADYMTIQEEADKHCMKYGKKAHLRTTHRDTISIFDCK